MTASALANLIELQRDHIVSCFVAEVRDTGLAPPGASRPMLIDHIPAFLQEIAGELRRAHSVRTGQDASDHSRTARTHGGQRWHAGYDLPTLIREYGVLRHCILRVARDSATEVSLDELEVLAKCIGVGVAEAATEYARFRNAEAQAQRETLEFLAEAGQLLSTSLDPRSTSSRLTTLLVPRLADWCAVHLPGTSVDDMPISHVDPAKIELVRDIYRRYPLPPDSPYGYPAVLRTGEPQLMPHVDSELLVRAACDAEHLALLRRVAACSWLIVPLRIQGNMFGALTLAYAESGRHYEQADLVLATELARRAAVAIDNARLYELSQKERSRVEAAMRAKDELLAMVSHELRSPLHSMLGWLQMLRSGALDETKREHALEVIERNAEAQAKLVADLLDVASMSTGRLRIERQELDLSDVARSTLEGIRPAAEAKQIVVSAELSAARLHGDAERLRQVMWNLVSNAVKYTPRHGKVWLRVWREADDVVLVVEDDGPGVPSEFLDQVFEAFRQASGGAARPHGGLGLGLAIARHVVELHGGTITVANRNSHGATFTVRLPVPAPRDERAPSPNVRATVESDAPAVEDGADSGTRVLLVDDEPDAREMLGLLLELCGMQVRVADSAASAREQLRDFEPDVIISDIGMPNEDGYALIRSLRTSSLEHWRNVPAIALTGFSRLEDRTRALVAGFNAHLVKPVDRAALVRTIREVMGASVTGPASSGH